GLDAVDLDIARGEFLTLLGPSGCGKTTSLRVIAGFESPSSGRVLLEGRDITTLRPFDRPVNTVFQDYALFPHMNVAENVGFGLSLRKLSGAEQAKRVGEALDMVGLAEKLGARVSELSGGQRQRIAIARALMLNPSLLVLDEPVSALDLSVQAQVLNLLADLQDEFKLTYVFISHDLSVVRYIADDVMVMYYGEAVEYGPRDEVFADPKHSYTKTLFAATPRADVASIKARLAKKKAA
ncbi:MAG: ABC transporter ATP-binding protein, partial [Mesorhizobium sp.]